GAPSPSLWLGEGSLRGPANHYADHRRFGRPGSAAHARTGRLRPFCLTFWGPPTRPLRRPPGEPTPSIAALHLALPVARAETGSSAAPSLKRHTNPKPYVCSVQPCHDQISLAPLGVRRPQPVPAARQECADLRRPDPRGAPGAGGGGLPPRVGDEPHRG